MGLFTRKIGTIFLKESSGAEEYIEKMQKLSANSKGALKNEIERNITIAKYGLIGENNIIFELKNSDMDMFVLHDIYLEFENLSAQIDFLLVTRKRIYVIECKNLIGNIEVNNYGDFIRTYEIYGKKIKEGIYSPITQNERHLNIIKNIRRESKGNFIIKKIFESNFDQNYKSLVVLANPKTVLNAKYAKKEVKEKIVRADQLIHKIKELDSEVTDYSRNEKEMREVTQFFLDMNKPQKSDYAKKYEEFCKSEKTKDKVKENSSHVNIDEKINVDVSKTVNIVNTDQKTDVQMINKEELIAKLKKFRLEQSRIENIKPYFIFNDSQMEDLITKYPNTKEELLKVSGFGEKKVQKYGDVILQLLKDSCKK